jgi:transposase
MAPGPKPTALFLSKTEREALQGLLRRRSTGQDVSSRARIVLACADPQATNTAIAKRLGVSRQSVITWRQRFNAYRLDGLGDAPRSGAPRKIGDEAIERLIAFTLESQPDNATQWSTRSMAKRIGMTQSMVSRVWRAFGLKPHRHVFSDNHPDRRRQPSWPAVPAGRVAFNEEHAGRCGPVRSGTLSTKTEVPLCRANPSTTSK